MEKPLTDNKVTPVQLSILDLQYPFDPMDIDWRIAQAGFKNKNNLEFGPDNRPTNDVWAKVLAYVDARAIQRRLDAVVGIGGWKTSSREVQGGKSSGFMCTLSIKINGEWVGKEDGAPETDFEAFKGGISKAFVRVAASGWGIGRYLYDLKETWAQTSSQEKEGFTERATLKYEHNGNKNCYHGYYWQRPILPDWALPHKETEQLIALPREVKMFLREKNFNRAEMEAWCDEKNWNYHAMVEAVKGEGGSDA